MLGNFTLAELFDDLSIMYNSFVYISQSRLLMYSEYVVPMCVVLHTYTGITIKGQS